jgi:hypothetical protein
MNEKDLLATLMRNPAFRRALKELMLHDANLANELGAGRTPDPIVHVWCAEMYDVNGGGTYYHPIIVPSNTAMSLESMMMVDNYTMMASEDQFEAYGYENMVNMFRSVYRNIPVRLIAVPKKTYDALKNSLTILVSNVLSEAQKCFTHFDNIAAMTRTNADMLKMQFLASVFNSMTTISSCFDRDMNLSDSADHEYDLSNHDEDDYVDDCDDEDEDWDDDDDRWNI